MIQVPYTTARPELKIADVIAFSGTGPVSTIIKHVTNSNVSHVGIVLHTNMYNNTPMVQLIQSTSLSPGFAGVTVSRLSTVVKQHKGVMWHLPLADTVRKKMQMFPFINFLLGTVGTPYDTHQAIQSALDTFLPDQPRDLSKLFCSELVVAGLQAGKIIDERTNPSEATPADVCKLPIYEKVVQIKGKQPLPLF